MEKNVWPPPSHRRLHGFITEKSKISRVSACVCVFSLSTLSHLIHQRRRYAYASSSHRCYRCCCRLLFFQFFFSKHIFIAILSSPSDICSAEKQRMKMRRTKLFAGSSHPELANLISRRLGHPLANATLREFANHETSVQLGVSVRNEDVFIIQSGSDTVNDHLMELLIMINACKGKLMIEMKMRC
jgi:hypothetical protein